MTKNRYKTAFGNQVFLNAVLYGWNMFYYINKETAANQ